MSFKNFMAKAMQTIMPAKDSSPLRTYLFAAIFLTTFTIVNVVIGTVVGKVVLALFGVKTVSFVAQFITGFIAMLVLSFAGGAITAILSVLKERYSK